MHRNSSEGTCVGNSLERLNKLRMTFMSGMLKFQAIFSEKCLVLWMNLAVYYSQDVCRSATSSGTWYS